MSIQEAIEAHENVEKRLTGTHIKTAIAALKTMEWLHIKGGAGQVYTAQTILSKFQKLGGQL